MSHRLEKQWGKSPGDVKNFLAIWSCLPVMIRFPTSASLISRPFQVSCYGYPVGLPS